MPSVPEFLLRRLYVHGSLRPAEGGFQFELLNTLAPVTLTGASLEVDGIPLPPGDCLVVLADGSRLGFDELGVEHPLALGINLRIAIEAGHPSPVKQLTIQVSTKEVGDLRFSICDFSARQGRGKIGPWKRFSKSIKRLQMRIRARRDPLRPALHFTPPAGWMNDPNGLICWQGQNHLFYQHNPDEAVWGNIHWGHAVSADLLHWRHLPIALAPTPGGADADGCFSGCAVEQNGEPRLVYTGVFPESQCLALGSPDLVSWRKHPGNPVIAAALPGFEVTGFRDPSVWREGGEWKMIIGSGLRGKGGALLLYRSPDLVKWEYMGIVLCADDLPREWRYGTMWECPQLFELDGGWVLLFSICDGSTPKDALVLTGVWDGQRFKAQRIQRVDEGNALYAPQTFLDHLGRRILFGWLRESRSDADQRRSGWSGVLSLPRSLHLNERIELIQQPIPENASLRQRLLAERKDWVLPAGQKLEVKEGLRTDRMEIVLRLADMPAAPLSMSLGSELELCIDPEGQCLKVISGTGGGEMPLMGRDQLEIRVSYDRSVVASYAHSHYITTRINQKLTKTAIHLISNQNTIIDNFQVWETG